jgi:hypothetical protein
MSTGQGVGLGLGLLAGILLGIVTGGAAMSLVGFGAAKGLSRATEGMRGQLGNILETGLSGRGAGRAARELLPGPPTRFKNTMSSGLEDELKEHYKSNNKIVKVNSFEQITDEMNYAREHNNFVKFVLDEDDNLYIGHIENGRSQIGIQNISNATQHPPPSRVTLCRSRKRRAENPVRKKQPGILWICRTHNFMLPTMRDITVHPHRACVT